MVRRATSGASGCRGGLQCELRSQPLSPCLVPSCRSPVHVFAYSCALPPTAVPAPILLPKPGCHVSPMFPAAKTHNANKHRGEVIISYSHCSGQRVLCGNSPKSFFSFRPSHARESWLAHASHLSNIPYLSCLLVQVPCLLLEAPSCSSLGFYGLCS